MDNKNNSASSQLETPQVHMATPQTAPAPAHPDITATETHMNPPSLTPPPPPTESHGMPISNSVPSEKKGGKIKFIVAGVLVFLFLFIGGAGATMAAVAYDKISLNNPELEDRIKQMVVGLPFMPKTKEFVLNASTIAHETQTKNAFNLSMSMQSDSDTNATLGLGQIDIEAKGDLDYSDPKDIKFSANVSVTKDFNMDIRKKDPIIYFKVNKVPPMVYSLLQMDQAQVEPVITQWIQYDTSGLDTEASSLLDQNKVTPEDDQTKTLEALLEQDLMEKMTMSEETVDGSEMYVFDLTADDQTLDKIFARMEDIQKGSSGASTLSTGPKPSSYIKNMKYKMWVNKNDYLMNKLSVTFDYDQAGMYQSGNEVTPSRVLGVSDVLGIEDMMMGSMGSSKYAVAMVLSMSDYGKDIIVETPANSLKPEEVMNQLMPLAGTGPSTSQGPDELSKRSRDAARLTDLANMQQAINVTVQEAVGNSAVEILCTGGLTRGSCRGMSNQGTRLSNGTGWVKVNMNNQRSVSVPSLPVDPINTSTLHYTYCSDGNNWEISTTLESTQQAPKMSNDGGDEDSRYEVGSDLTLIGPTGGCKY